MWRSAITCGAVAFSAAWFLVATAVPANGRPRVLPSATGRNGASAPVAATASSSHFTYVGTTTVTPDGNFLGGGFVRAYYLAATDHVLVTFNTPLSQPEGNCPDAAHAYKEYTTEMQETDAKGIISCDGGFDIGSLLIGDSYYLVAIHREGEAAGWRMAKYDAPRWEQQTVIFHHLDDPYEQQGDPMVAYVNGEIDASSQYNASGSYPDLEIGAATHHEFFTTDLEFLREKILTDTPHIVGSSMIYVDGVYYFVTANAFFGDVVVMRYDQDWNYLGVKTLVTKGHFSEGLAFDGQRFYVTYLDTTQRTPPNSLPVNLNVRLAAFDRDWDLIEDIPVTAFTWADLRQPGRPYLLLHGDRLYVSYDCDTIDPVTHQENLKGQAYVAMYEVAAVPHRTVHRHLRRTVAD